jgi:hypothetical protein
MKGITIKSQKILLGSLFLRVCRTVKQQVDVPGCDCNSAGRCPLHAYCRAARQETRTADRLEKGFWLAMLGITGSLVLYALLPILFALF